MRKLRSLGGGISCQGPELSAEKPDCELPSSWLQSTSIFTASHGIVSANQFFGKQNNRMKEPLIFVFFGSCDVYTPIRADSRLPTV